MSRALFCLVFVLGCLSLAAQYPGWTNYINSEGSYSICGTDTDIWVGCNGGLVRYDRDSMEPTFYTHANSGIPYNDVYFLAADSLGNIWCAYPYRGLSRFDGSNWTHFTVPGTSQIVSFAVCAPDDIWMGTVTEGLYHFDGSTFTQHTEFQAIPCSGASSLAVDKLGRLWFQASNDYAGSSSSVYCYDGTTFTQYNPPDTSYGKYSIRFDSNNTLWYATYYGWLWHYDGTTWTNYTYANSGLSGEYIFDIYFDSQDNLWVWQASGFCRFDGVNWQDYPELDGYYSLVPTLYIDQEDVLWFGGGNLKRYTNGQVQIFPTSNSGLSSSYVKKTARDNIGTIWFATYYGLDWFDGINWGHVDLPGSNDNIADIAFDSQGRLWIASVNEGLLCYANGAFTSWNIDNSDIVTNYLEHIDIDAQDRIWISSGGGVSCLDNNTWTNYNTGNAPFPTNLVSALYLDASGRVWAGFWQDPIGPGALAVLDNGIWTIYDSSNSVLNNLRINAITTHNGIVWISTEGGLARFDGANWELWTTANTGLLNNRVRYIAFDSNGHMFCSTAAGGLAHYDGSFWTIWTSNNSGLQDNYPKTLMIEPGDRLWICNIYNGVTVFDHEAMGSEDPELAPSVNSIRVYPNPFSDKLSFSGLETKNDTKLRLFNLRGQILATWDVSAGEEACIDLSAQGLTKLPAGVYIWQAKAGNKVRTGKVLKLNSRN